MSSRSLRSHYYMAWLAGSLAEKLAGWLAIRLLWLITEDRKHTSRIQDPYAATEPYWVAWLAGILAEKLAGWLAIRLLWLMTEDRKSRSRRMTDFSAFHSKIFKYLHRKHTSWVQDPYAATTEWPAWLEFWLKSWLAGLLFGCFGWWQRIASQGQGAWLTFLLLMQKSFLLCHKTWPLLLFKHYFCLI